MRQLRSILCFCTVLILAGCATHPLPKHVTRDTTYSIVYKILCEGRQAIDDITVNILRKSRFPELQRLSVDIEDGTRFARELLTPKYLNLLKRDKNIRDIFILFTLSSVGFDFRFNITEDNDNMIDMNLRTFFSRDIFTLGIKNGKNLQRISERKFQKGTTFFGLHQEPFDPIQCQQVAARHRHLIYPITGKIGLREVFDTYMNLTVGPSGPDNGLGAAVFGQQKTEKFSDKLTFTTELVSMLTPKIELNPAAAATRSGLLNATGTFGNSRKDIHEVTIAVATGPLARAETLVAALNKGRANSLQRTIDILDLLRAESTFELIRENDRRIRELQE